MSRRRWSGSSPSFEAGLVPAARRPDDAMNTTAVEQIARVLLYEGYILYPYRPSALKNRHRWTFGGLFPRAYSEAVGGTESWFFQSECLARCGGTATLSVRLRFLHPLQSAARDSTWQEAVEREGSVTGVPVNELVLAPRQVPVPWPPSLPAERVQHGLAGATALPARAAAGR